MKISHVLVVLVGIVLAIGTAADGSWVATSIPNTIGVYDENTYQTNAVDSEVVPGSLAAFKASMAAAYAAELGGVLSWDWPALNGGKYGTEAGEIVGPFTIPYGVSQTNTLVVTIPSNDKASAAPDAMMISGRSGNVGLTATSAQSTSSYWIDSVMYSQRYAAAGILGEIWIEFPAGLVAELGITALPAQGADGLAGAATRGGAAYTQEVTVTFSGGGTQTLTATMNNVGSAGDTFFHFAAPAGQTIVRMDGLDPAHTGMTGYDDLGLILVPEPATMSLLAIGGLGVLLRRKRR